MAPFFIDGIKQFGSPVAPTMHSSSQKWDVAICTRECFELRTPERSLGISPLPRGSVRSIIYRQRLESTAAELYSDITPCGGAIE